MVACETLSSPPSNSVAYFIGCSGEVHVFVPSSLELAPCFGSHSGSALIFLNLAKLDFYK